MSENKVKALVGLMWIKNTSETGSANLIYNRECLD